MQKKLLLYFRTHKSLKLSRQRSSNLLGFLNAYFYFFSKKGKIKITRERKIKGLKKVKYYIPLASFFKKKTIVVGDAGD